MATNVTKFRQVKHGEPTKLKVLVEDFTPARWPILFIGLVTAAASIAFVAAYLL